MSATCLEDQPGDDLSSGEATGTIHNTPVRLLSNIDTLFVVR
jgi:hypothetical protein